MGDVTTNARELYNEYRFGTFSYGQKREAFEPLLFELLGRATGDTQLYDIGCGSGYWIETYLHAGIRNEHITSVDITPSNIAELGKKGFNAVIGDVLDLPFENNVSDLTVCIGVIHHTEDPFKAFSELARITKPGGYIYLNVYNKLNPYYYLVHRATFPIRYCYWHWSRRVIDIVYPLAKLLFQPLAYVALGKFLDDKTCKTMFMDQVITPRAHLFSRYMLDSYARKCGCMVEKYMYNRYFLMLSAIIRAD